jgi:glycosyltransferase involved in cell wall biosynthesis
MKQQKLFIEADSITYEHMSGIGHSTLEIIRQFDKVAGQDLQVTIIVPYGKKKSIKKYKFKNSRVRSLPIGQRYINYLLTRTSFPLPIDLLFGQGIYIFPNYKNWPLAFSKSITFVHDVTFKQHPETLNPKNLVYLEANFERWLARTDSIISISESSAAELRHHFPNYASKVSVVYLGVDPSMYHQRSKQEIDKVCAEYGLPLDYFLCVGNIEPRKNIARLLDAYKIYCDTSKSPKALVIIGGDGWKNESILQTIKHLQALKYRIIQPKAYVADEDLPTLYSGAKALIHIAIHEGFGLPPVQAQACGTFTIVSDLPVMKEVVNPKSAIFVNPYDINDIASAMGQVPVTQPKQTTPLLTWKNTMLGIRKIIDKMVTQR